MPPEARSNLPRLGTDARRVPAEGQSLSPHAHAPDYRIEDRGFETPCWIWQKFLLKGYGRVSLKSKGHWAHRAYYKAAFGPIPEGQHVHHRCEIPACVNPDHLELTIHHLHLRYHKQEDSSLNWADVREIRRLHNADEASIFEIGDRYSLGKSQVARIVSGEDWVDPTYEPGRVATCPECGDEFLARKHGQRFCCTLHRRRYNGRMGWRRRAAA